MPEWGLTRGDRKTEPYGLAEWWLQPGKVITDPIHGDIFVTRLEQALLDTAPVQRLRRVRQLGTTHIVYPGATHSRFSHSLGAVQVVQNLLDAVINQRNRVDAPADLFAEWETQARQVVTEEGKDPFEPKGPDKDLAWRLLYRRWMAEATVLARLGALLHDIGHLPFGHTIEDELRLLAPHDENVYRFDEIWKKMIRSAKDEIKRQAQRAERKRTWSKEREDWLKPLLRGEPLYQDLRRLILSKEKDKEGNQIDASKKIKYPFTADMVGNTICADLLDYLQRDHVFSGLPISLGRRYLSSFYITPETKAGIYKKRMALLIHRHGRERKDIVTEILKHLRYRYELQERVLVHHTKLAADAMVGKMIEAWLEGKRAELEGSASAELATATVSPQFTYPDEKKGRPDRVERVARWSLESLFMKYGDDGVLEQIAQEQGPEGFGAAGELANMLLERRLYKPAANAVRPAAAEGIYKEFGSSEWRRKLEKAAAEHAQLDEEWHVVLWVPDPEMRLKLAELLVDDGKGIAQFKDKSKRGSDIYDAHKDLWTVSVFVHPSVSVAQTRAALAKLAKGMGITWDTHRDELGPDPDVAPEHLAAVKACDTEVVDAEVKELVKMVSRPQEVAARRDFKTQRELDHHVKAQKKHRDKNRRAP
jgi:HD superfamily phosphohydrolase